MPWIPAEPVKRWREPCDTGHTDGARYRGGNNRYMEYKRDERISYEQNRLGGTIIGPAHPLLGSWYVTPEHNSVERVIVQTADIRRLRGDNVPLAWRQSATTTEAIDADEETAESTAASARKHEPGRRLIASCARRRRFNKVDG